MPKNIKKLPQKKRAKKQRRRDKRLALGGVLLIAALGLGTVAGSWRKSFGVQKLQMLFLAPLMPPVPPPSNPSKEYIYAGGRLIATEAPVTLAAPASLVATTLSNLPSPQVTITWEATAGADHYQVERTSNISANYTTINANVGSTSFTDTSVSSVTAYLYRVRAVDSAGNVSPYSNIDLATAISFTDDTIVAQSTWVKAAHVNELRQAVDAVRATANLSAANWGGSIIAGVTSVQATHIQDLRVNLDQARSMLGLAACSYSDNSVEALRASYIKRDHINELRQCVK